MSFPVAFYFPQEPAHSCFNMSYYVDIHIPKTIEVYENTSFHHMEVIQLGRNDLYQLIAISFFEEEDFDDADLSSLYADVPNFTGSTPFITPGELVGIFTR